LSEYLLEMHNATGNSGTGMGKTVLELGCGHGFPGLMAVRCGCEQLVLSDFNREVICQITWPNIALNAPDKLDRVRCFSGDWESFSSFVKSEKSLACPEVFDLILSAEVS
jgi:predicted nicotinamide N-methyase